ncbi:MAG TPA: ABC transporter permease, partial [Clostridiaceae bacterium]|nr:ABC transporter permease [Clostridiaceae bacterium]
MNNSLTFRLLKNDFKKNVLVNLTLFLFLFLSATLAAGGALVIERLSGSLEEIMTIARPPHFLQMHVGKIDNKALDDWMIQQSDLIAYQVQDMMLIDGVNIDFYTREGRNGSFADSMLDHYFVTQNRDFDYLLDLNKVVAAPAVGEIGVPVSYLKRYELKPGDTLVVFDSEGKGAEFKIACGIRDAQMGSSLCSSVRFLLHPQDFDSLSDSQRHESIIGVRLQDGAQAFDFQKRYENEAALPKNGMAITATLIRLFNGIGDGLMAGLMIFAALILILIAMLNVRFTLQATVADEIREIGTLKAIGMTDRDIKGLYGLKYGVIALFACILGAVASFPLSKLFTANVALNFGLAQPRPLGALLPFLACALVIVLSMLILQRILGILSHLTIHDVLAEGTLALARSNKIRRNRNRGMPRQGESGQNMVANDRVGKSLVSGLPLPFILKLSLFEFRKQRRTWTLMIFVVFLTSCIILLPLNLQQTLAADDFVRYMGVPESDLLIEINPRNYTVPASGGGAEQQTVQQDSNPPNAPVDIASVLTAMPEVEKSRRFVTRQIKLKVGEQWEDLLIESGDYTDFSLSMLDGRLPMTEGELALSDLNAH